MIGFAKADIGTETHQPRDYCEPTAALGRQMLKNDVFNGNAILSSLRGKEKTLALEEGEVVDVKVHQTIYQPEERITEAYFPLGAILSVVAQMKDGGMIEIGTIGREGTSAVPLLMGAETSANESFCQVPGKAWKMPAQTFRSLLATSQSFREFLNRYLQAYVNMLGQLAACNRLHSVYERCARWLLMTGDRVGSNEFPLTHEFLAIMLGSRRAGVTVAAAILQKAGFIHYSHGTITIVDRTGLEATTCECYRITTNQFGDLLSLRPAAIDTSRRRARSR
ncbi:MAG TPA: Crp/Fnr family transcriptional regulator [Candidatus Eremiobacteraceae bacterium]|nr:Crp/Fnr family transcriptional regulator [Candidatus Eremiobacteraceae bacterium]